MDNETFRFRALPLREWKEILINCSHDVDVDKNMGTLLWPE